MLNGYGSKRGGQWVAVLLLSVAVTGCGVTPETAQPVERALIVADHLRDGQGLMASTDSYANDLNQLPKTLRVMEQAEQHFEKARQFARDSERPLWLLAMSQFAQGLLLQKAVESYDSVFLKTEARSAEIPESDRAERERLDKLRRAKFGDAAESFDYYRRFLLVRRPDRPVFTRLKEVYQYLGDWDAAITIVRRYREYHGDRLSAKEERAIVSLIRQYSMRLTEEAETDLFDDESPR